MKAACIILIIAAFSLTGFAYAGNITKRIELLNEIKKITVLIEGELRYGNSTVEEVLLSVSKRVKAPFDELLVGISDELKTNCGKSVGEIWFKLSAEKLSTTQLLEEDIKKFGELGGCLGYLDIKSQGESIALYKQQLQLILDEINEDAGKKIKMYRSLGVSLGILTAIVML